MLDLDGNEEDPFKELTYQLSRFKKVEDALKWVGNWAKSFYPPLTTLTISMPLITHIAYTQNKIKADRLMKINGQKIYDGTLNKFKRAIVVDNMHYYFEYNIPSAMIGLNIKKVRNIEYIFRTVINHGNISMRNGRRIWVKPKPNYEPNWDIDNLASIWMKTGNDSLVSSNVLSEDNVAIFKKGSFEFVEVESIDDLELIVKIHY